MTQLSGPHRSRLLPQSNVTPEEIHRRKVQRHELGARCRAIFERLSPNESENHYNWFIAVDADSENYLLDPKLEGLLQLIKHQYTNKATKLTIFRLNETGACGKI
jgi:hypothetical protein